MSKRKRGSRKKKQLIEEPTPTESVDDVVEAVPEPEKTKAQLQQELEDLKTELELKDQNIQSLQSTRAYTITKGVDETVSIRELKAIFYLFPDFPEAPTKRQLGETIRPQYIAALRRLRMFADI